MVVTTSVRLNFTTAIIPVGQMQFVVIQCFSGGMTNAIIKLVAILFALVFFLVFPLIYPLQ